jgi:hypothetical protein
LKIINFPPTFAIRFEGERGETDESAGQKSNNIENVVEVFLETRMRTFFEQLE